MCGGEKKQQQQQKEQGKMNFHVVGKRQDLPGEFGRLGSYRLHPGLVEVEGTGETSKMWPVIPEPTLRREPDR